MPTDLAVFSQVVLIDLVLAGDNAIVVGALAARLPAHQRQAAVAAGIGFAVLARVVMSLTVAWLLLIPGVMILGGLLLFWVAWKMWKDLRGAGSEHATSRPPADALHKAVFAIAAADVSMSLDNVLGVAGAADGHTGALVFGLILSVALMGLGAAAIAGVINKHRWIGYVGLGLIVFVACRMVLHGF